MRTLTLTSPIDSFFHPRGLAGAEPQGFRPPLDLVETPTHYALSVDLPGVDPEKVDVAFDEGVLTVRGERAPAGELPDDARAVRRERRDGAFARRVAFRQEVEIDVEHIEAAFKDGVLTVTVPKVEKAGPRQIPVTMH